MSNTRAALGILAWFLGILVPVAHHCVLCLSLASSETNLSVFEAQRLFGALPWVDWVYMTAMAAVGAILFAQSLPVASWRD